MPWYPRPAEDFVAGFWDGQQWSIAEAEHHLMVEGKWIAFDDILEVSYWSADMYAFPAPGVTTGRPRIERTFTLSDRSGGITSLDFGVNSLVDAPDLQAAWDGLVDISRRLIEPRIARRLLELLRSGQQYEIRDGWTFITLSRSGFSGRALRERQWSWSDYETTAVNPHFNNMSPTKFNGQVRVWARSGSKNKVQMVTGFKTYVPNAVVLGSLLPMCASEFGSGAPISPS